MSLVDKAEELWIEVCSHVDNVLRECDQYGVNKILIVPHPSLSQRLGYLEIIESVLRQIDSRISDGDNIQESSRNHSARRNITNTLQQIGFLRLLLAAALAGDEAEFERIYRLLRGQSRH
jgi:hypothetical protein